MAFKVNPGGYPVGLTPDNESDTTSANDQSQAPPKPNYLICDRTGFRVPVSEGLVEEWTGAMVRKSSWEPRHPQDFVRSRPNPEEGSGGGGGAKRSRAELADVFDSHGVTSGEIVSNEGGFINIGPGAFTATATANGASQVDLTWTAPFEQIFDVVRFIVYREEDDGGTAVYITQVDGDTLTYSDTTVDLATYTYNWYVVAIDSAHNFRISNDASLDIDIVGGPGGTGLPTSGTTVGGSGMSVTDQGTDTETSVLVQLTAATITDTQTGTGCTVRALISAGAAGLAKGQVWKYEQATTTSLESWVIPNAVADTSAYQARWVAVSGDTASLNHQNPTEGNWRTLWAGDDMSIGFTNVTASYNAVVTISIRDAATEEVLASANFTLVTNYTP